MSESDPTAFRASVMDGYDELAAEYDAQREAQFPDVLVDALESTLAGGRLLDVGCGGGRGVLTAYAERFDAVGLDVSREQLRIAGDNAPAAVRLQGDTTALPFPTDAFDAVTALHSVIHVPRDQHAAVYRELRRVLADDGVAVVTAGIGAWEGENEDWLDAGATMQWSFPAAEETETMFADAGLDVVESEEVDEEYGGGSWRFYRQFKASASGLDPEGEAESNI